MLRSLKSQIFMMVIFIVAIVGVCVLVFTMSEVEKSMLRVEERSDRNVLNLVELTIETRYKSLLLEKLSTIKQRKDQLKQRSQFILTTLRHNERLVRQGELSVERAQALTLEWLQELKFAGHGEYVFVYGPDFRAVAYPEKAMIGDDLARFRDFKGQPVVMAARKEAMRFGGAYSTYRWKQLGSDEIVKKFGYFVYFKEWDWIVALAADIEDVERVMQDQLNSTIGILKQKISKVRVAETGYVYIFNGDKKVLVKPDGKDIGRVRNLATGNLLLDDLMAQAHREESGQAAATNMYNQAGGLEHLEDLGGPLPESMLTFVSYFKALDWYIAATVKQAEIEAPAKALFQRQSLIMGAVLLVSLLLGLLLANRIVKPLKLLTEHARKLSERDFSKALDETSTGLVAIKGKSEVARLAQTFAFMEESLHENVNKLMDVTASKERIESELNIARDIQLGLLKKIFPPFPDNEEFDLFASLDSARQVGGDLYEFFFIDDNHLCFAIGDVSDKGVPASLFMAVTKTLIKSSASPETEPGEMMAKINNALCQDNPNCMFVTLFIGILDIRSGAIRYANAGHNPPLLIRAHSRSDGQDGQPEFMPPATGPVAGVFCGLDYTTEELTLGKGDVLLTYTDGVTEAMNEAEQLYSDARLVACAQSRKGTSPQVMVTAIREDVRTYAGQAEQSDDVTMLCLQFNGRG